MTISSPEPEQNQPTVEAAMWAAHSNKKGMGETCTNEQTKHWQIDKEIDSYLSRDQILNYDLASILIIRITPDDQSQPSVRLFDRRVAEYCGSFVWRWDQVKNCPAMPFVWMLLLMDRHCCLWMNPFDEENFCDNFERGRFVPSSSWEWRQWSNMNV